MLRVSVRSLVTHASRRTMLPNGVRLDDAHSRTDPNKSEHAAPKEPEKNLKKPEGLQRPISRKTLKIVVDGAPKKNFAEELKDRAERPSCSVWPNTLGNRSVREIEFGPSVHRSRGSNAEDADRWCPA